MEYLSPKLIDQCFPENPSNTEILLSVELFPRFEESNRFLLPKSGFYAIKEPWPVCSGSNNMHVELDPKTIEGLKNMSWPTNCFPQHGYGGEIHLLQVKEWS